MKTITTTALRANINVMKQFRCNRTESEQFLADSPDHIFLFSNGNAYIPIDIQIRHSKSSYDTLTVKGYNQPNPFQPFLTNH